MSNFKTNSNDQAITELMAVVRKNAVQSTCLDAFESLLSEVEDSNYSKVIIADMHKVIEELMHVFRAVDKIDDKSIESRMLTYEFIQPERFFKNSVHAVNQYIYLNAAINAKFFHNNPAMVKIWDIGKSNKLGKVWAEQFYKIGSPYVDAVLAKFNVTDNNQAIHMQEECRKAILLWNYCPAIYKAMVQTKRRALGLDMNSKKFI